MNLVQVSSWAEYPWLRHGFSTRSGGVTTVYGGHSLNLGRTKEDAPELVTENRRLLLESVMKLDAPSGQRLDHHPEAPQPIVFLRQTHSTVTHVVALPEEAATVREGDGLMTGQTGIPLSILTADCVPVIVVDPRQRTIAVFHAGWRGTVGAIVESGIARMADAFHSRPSDLIAAIGPSIGSCCYTVGDEVRSAFTSRFAYADRLFTRDQLNLWEANRQQLLTAGVLPANITVIGECTGCALDRDGQRRYFSHRIDHGVTGRMMTLACIV